MQAGKSFQQGWPELFARFGRAAVPYWFAVSGLALGAGAIVKDEPLAGACGAVAGVTAGLIQQWRARFYRDHVDALRERLRSQRSESEQVAAQLRQTVSSLQTELWQQRMVALATPAFGLPLRPPAAPAAAAAGVRADVPAEVPVEPPAVAAAEPGVAKPGPAVQPPGSGTAASDGDAPAARGPAQEKRPEPFARAS